jgi:uncharacterized protein YegP (UPF0339 family)
LPNSYRNIWLAIEFFCSKKILPAWPKLILDSILFFYLINTIMRYRAYRTKKDNQFYFQFVTNDGGAVLNSQAYASKADCFTGIRSVMDNAANPARFEAVAGNVAGTFAFVLKAGNHVEIARSVDYATEDEANNMLALCQKEIPNAKSATDTNEDAPKAETTKSSMTSTPSSGTGSSKDDDYRPLAFYEARISGVENGFDQFKDEEGQEYYFTYNMNGQVMLISEGYNSEVSRNKGIQSVAKNIDNPDRYQRGIHKNGKHYFNLRAGNNQEIATSRWCDSEEELKLTIQALTTGNPALLKPAMTRASAAPDSGHQMDQYLDCGAYSGAIGFHIFDKDGAYYFSYNDGNGNTLLRSQGYKSEAARANGVESVKKNGPIHERWVMGEDNGQWYYALKAGNHQEIARSCYYATQNEMKSGLVDATYAFEEKPAPVAVAAPLTASTTQTSVSQKIADDYMPCEAYIGAAGFHTFFDENRQEYFFSYNDEDGNTLLRSEGYTTAAARNNGIESVKKNAPIEARWKKETALNGKYHYYVLRAANNQEIARSCYYEDHEKMNTNFILLGGAFATIGSGVVANSMTGSSSSTIVRAANPIVNKENEDDYLPCQEYEGKTVSDKKNNVALFKHSNDQFYFVVYHPDGSVRLRSEGFETTEARDRELSSVLKYYEHNDMYTRIERGDYYIEVLKDKTGREIGRSCLQKEGLAVIPPVVTSSSSMVTSSSSSVIAGGIASGLAGGGMVERKESVLKEKVVVPPAVPKPVAPIAKEFTPPPPPPKKVDVVAAMPVTPVAAGGGGFNWWWLLPLLLLIPLLIFLLRGCDGCKAKPPVETPTTPTPPVVPPADTMKIDVPKKTALCPSAGTLKLAPGAGSNVSSYLSDPEATYPKRFTLDNVSFGSNTANLSSAAQKELDDLVVCLKSCENTSVDIYGYITSGESSSYRGSKEVSLDDVRAKSVFEYLKKRGIADSRLSFQGEGIGDSSNIIIQVNSK